MTDQAEITLTVNGQKIVANVPSRQNLLDFVREQIGLTGSHAGCEQGICGACQMRVDGVVIRGCLMLAIQADGSNVLTIEGLTSNGVERDLQQCFVTRNAMQCGFCTAGMIFTASELLQSNPQPTRTEIREALSGNFCRCTGYQAIVDAIAATAAMRR